MARAVRALLAVCLVAAQLATGSLAAQTVAQGAPCPAHLAFASNEDHRHAHHGHSAEAAGHAYGHEQQSGEDESEAPPHFSFACCAACAVGVIASITLLLAPNWHRRPALPVARGLEPGELPSTDPPPRILL